MKSWFEIRCLVPASEADLLSDDLARLTGNGVCTANLAVDTFSMDTIQEPDIVCLLAYINGETDPAPLLAEIEALLQTSRQRSSEDIPAASCTVIHEEDWANNWKAYFKPTRIGQHLVIKPSWETYQQQSDDIIIELDPGMAFGTGTHQTTRLCLEALERLLHNNDQSMSVLDVGTGSGVLAIAAALMGGAPVIGVDIDADAVAVANHNTAQNGVGTQIACSTTPLEQIPGWFDLVIANILAEDLVRMRHALTERLARHGTLILSGILLEREELVITGFADTNLVLAAVTRSGEWACLEFARAD
jgi:ribosomal protein L11 methyltransferase